jgi:hypothetical protein
MGARLYTPGTARFLSTDPIYGGNANPYEYCNGDGVNCRDTTGLGQCTSWRPYWWSSWSLKLCGTVVNVGRMPVLIARDRCSHWSGSPCPWSPLRWLWPGQWSSWYWDDTDSFRYYGWWVPVWDGQIAWVYIPYSGWS